MLDQHMNLLKELGYDTSLMGAKFFVGISQQVQEIIDKNNGTLENINELLPKNIYDINEYINCLFLEDYAFFYECGKNKYFKEIKDFLRSKKIKDEKQMELNKKVFGEIYNDIDILLNFSLYLSNNKQNGKDSNKQLIKTINE